MLLEVLFVREGLLWRRIKLKGCPVFSGSPIINLNLNCFEKLFTYFISIYPACPVESFYIQHG